MLTRRQLIASGAGLLLAGAGTRTAAQTPAPPSVSSARYISMNADTGAIFAEKGAHDQVAIASLTKVFTAMQALQMAPLSTRITTTSDDYQPAEATVMGFGAGETFTLEELIYGMMLPSGNDAAYAIARSLGHQEGDTAAEAVQRFMDLVNQRVAAMGLTNTHLLNPDGWGVPGHYSSAADVAAFMSYASSNDFLLQVMGTYRYTTSAGYVLINTNRALTTAPSVIGGKTGYDGDSGWCLVQLAQRQNTRIVAVNLDGVAPDVWYNDNLLLLDYGFDRQSALGGQPFDGETMSWADPSLALFTQAGPGEVSIAGETDDDEVIITREETDPVPMRVTREPEPTQPETVAFDGRNGDGLVAGIGATVLAGAMAVSRWKDLGGDGSGEAVRASLDSVGRSLKRALPPLPSISRGQRADSDPDDYDDDPDVLEDDADFLMEVDATEPDDEPMPEHSNEDETYR